MESNPLLCNSVSQFTRNVRLKCKNVNKALLFPATEPAEQRWRARATVWTAATSHVVRPTTGSPGIISSASLLFCLFVCLFCRQRPGGGIFWVFFNFYEALENGCLSHAGRTPAEKQHVWGFLCAAMQRLKSVCFMGWLGLVFSPLSYIALCVHFFAYVDTLFKCLFIMFSPHRRDQSPTLSGPGERRTAQNTTETLFSPRTEWPPSAMLAAVPTLADTRRQQQQHTVEYADG